MSVTSQVPDVGTPVFDANGYMNPVWHQFFFMLLRRTGGTDGIDAVEQGKLITANTMRIGAEEALSASMVAPEIKPLPANPESMVWPHGVHDEPELHAVATPLLNGFMSAEDKAKLDAFGLYETGTWAPSITFVTPGDLAVTYSEQIGTYTRIGSLVVLDFQITTSAFTYSTASGALLVNGMPIPSPLVQFFAGTMSFEGLTRVGYTQFVPMIFAGSSSMRIVASGSGVGRNISDTNTTTSGTNVSLIGSISYYVG